MPVKLIPHFPPLALLAILGSSIAVGQELIPDTVAPLPAPFSAPSASCNPWKIQPLPDELSFRQRACAGFSKLASPGSLLSAGALAGYGQWRNNPERERGYSADLATRFARIYARRAARTTGEVLVGYLHHEDPRPHPSLEKGAWRRTRAAFLSVLNSPDIDGGSRIALAPIAGALGSGLTGMALNPRQNNWSDGFRLSGLTYSRYFVSAVFREFSPELWSLAPNFVKKRRVAP